MIMVIEQLADIERFAENDFGGDAEDGGQPESGQGYRKNHSGPIIPRLLLQYLPTATGLSLAFPGRRAGASGDRSARFP